MQRDERVYIGGTSASVPWELLHCLVYPLTKRTKCGEVEPLVSSFSSEVFQATFPTHCQLKNITKIIRENQEHPTETNPTAHKLSQRPPPNARNAMISHLPRNTSRATPRSGTLSGLPADLALSFLDAPSLTLISSHHITLASSSPGLLYRRHGWHVTMSSIVG